MASGAKVAGEIEGTEQAEDRSVVCWIARWIGNPKR